MTNRGYLIGLTAYVWYCGDDECGCSQPHIDALYRNPSDRRWIVRETLWEGSFRTDHEPGGEDELLILQAAMATFWPTAERSIAWGWVTQTEDYFKALKAA